MKTVAIFFIGLLFLGCGKKVVKLDPEWAKEWVSGYNSEHTLTIKENGWAVFKHKNGRTYRGNARFEYNVMTIGRGKFIVTQHPTYFGPPLNRWSIEVDNLQLLNYEL